MKTFFQEEEILPEMVEEDPAVVVINGKIIYVY